MRSLGLKGQILITLFLLLVSAMVLAEIVITVFWEQSLIRSESQRVRTILSLTTLQHEGDPIESGSKLPPSAAMVLRSQLGAECVLIKTADDDAPHGEKTCPYAEDLRKAANDSIASRSPVSVPLGSTWSLFTARPEFLVTAVPMPGDPPGGSIGAITSLKPIHAQVRQKQRIILAYLVFNTLFLTTIGFFRLARATVRPVERLVRLTEAHDEAGEFTLFPGREAGEFGQLSTALNRMTRRIDDDRKRLRETVASLEAANRKLQQAQEEMVRAEKLAAVGRLSAGLAHEIGNPIGIIQGYLELLQRESLSPEDRRQFSQRAIGELNRINRLIRQLLDFARTGPPSTRPVSIHELVHAVADMFRNREKMEQISFHLDLTAENDLVLANEESLRQVLLNCLLNSVDAINEKGENSPGEISIATRNLDGGPAGELEITIRDNGCGIDPSHLHNIFDPFFTTKEPGKGTGLGLAVSHTIVEAAGGRIQVKSEAGAGTEFRILLPRSG